VNLQSDATYSINGNGRLFNNFPADFRVPQFFPYSKADSRCPRVIHASRQTFNAPGRSVFQGRLSMPRVIPYSKADFRCPGSFRIPKLTSDAPGSFTLQGRLPMPGHLRFRSCTITGQNGNSSSLTLSHIFPNSSRASSTAIPPQSG